jgi:hypothetical protein
MSQLTECSEPGVSRVENPAPIQPASMCCLPDIALYVG